MKLVCLAQRSFQKVGQGLEVCLNSLSEMEFPASTVGYGLCLAALAYVYLTVSKLLYQWCRAYYMLRKLARPGGTGILGVPREALNPRRHAVFAGMKPLTDQCQVFWRTLLRLSFL
jgi:hypothetical protein